MTTETLSVPDISCDHCQRTIETALGALPGVRADVDVAARTVQVSYDEATVTPPRSARPSPRRATRSPVDPTPGGGRAGRDPAGRRW
jgi:copper chaperone CopZ